MSSKTSFWNYLNAKDLEEDAKDLEESAKKSDRNCETFRKCETFGRF